MHCNAAIAALQCMHIAGQSNLTEDAHCWSMEIM